MAIELKDSGWCNLASTAPCNVTLSLNQADTVVAFAMTSNGPHGISDSCGNTWTTIFEAPPSGLSDSVLNPLTCFTTKASTTGTCVITATKQAATVRDSFGVAAYSGVDHVEFRQFFYLGAALVPSPPFTLNLQPGGYILGAQSSWGGTWYISVVQGRLVTTSSGAVASPIMVADNTSPDGGPATIQFGCHSVVTDPPGNCGYNVFIGIVELFPEPEPSKDIHAGFTLNTQQGFTPIILPS